MGKLTATLVCLMAFIIGVAIGGYSFSQTQPRTFLSLKQCQDCFSSKELAGMIASAGINKFPGLVPSVLFETDKTLVIKNPFRVKGAMIDYVIFPKKDIKNIGEVSAADAPYIIDAYLVARHLIEEQKTTNYQLMTNGPGFQDLSYLHFHLVFKTSRYGRERHGGDTEWSSP